MLRIVFAFALLLGLLTVLLLPTGVEAQESSAKDTPKAAVMRKVLKTKISVAFKDTRLEDALEEIKDQAKGFGYLMDTKGGVSRNQYVNFKGKDVTIEEVFEGMFAKTGLGYIVISDLKDPYDGRVRIKQGKERGFPLKK